MGLETGNTLDDLNPLWPLKTDALGVQNEHSQLIKSVLQSAFGGNPSPLEFTSDLKFSGYLVSPQMGKAGAAVNGADGVILGASYGIGAGLVSRISAGTYEVQLTESFVFDDLHCTFNIDYGIGGLGIGVMSPAQTNTDGTWVRLVLVAANDPTTALDPTRFSFEIGDFGRSP